MSLVHKYSFENALDNTQYIVKLFQNMNSLQLERYVIDNPGVVDVIFMEYSVGLLTHPDFLSANEMQKEEALDAFVGTWELFKDYASLDLQVSMLEVLSSATRIDAVSVILETLTENDVIDIGAETWGNIAFNVSVSYQNPLNDVSVKDANMVLENMLDLPPPYFVSLVPFLDQMGAVLEQLSVTANITGFNIVAEYVGESIVYLETDVLENIFANVAFAHDVANSIVTIDEVNDVLGNLVETFSSADVPLSTALGASFIDDLLETMKFAENDQGLDAILTNLTLSADLDYFSTWLDVVFGTDSDDVQIYDASAASSEFLYGFAGDDYIEDQLGDTYINAGDGDDVINLAVTPSVGAGVNLVYGGDGRDTIYAGAGNDTIVFRAEDTGVDMIHDFNANFDKIDVTDLLDGYDPLQDAISDFIILTQSGDDLVVSVDEDGTGSASSARDIVTIHDAAGEPLEFIIDLQDYV